MLWCCECVANGEGGDGNGGHESENAGDNDQNGRPKRFPRRRFPRRSRPQSETQDGAQNDADGGNENGQLKPKPRRNRRFNRKRSDGGENQVIGIEFRVFLFLVFGVEVSNTNLLRLFVDILQDGGQEVQNTVTESTA